MPPARVVLKVPHGTQTWDEYQIILKKLHDYELFGVPPGGGGGVGRGREKKQAEELAAAWMRIKTWENASCQSNLPD